MAGRRTLTVLREVVKSRPARAALLEGIQTLTKFDAGGMLGTVDIANRTLSSCTLLTQFTNDKFVRVWPAKKGTFDCSPKNYVKFEADYLGG